MYTVSTPDDGQRNSPKHVEFYSKNNSEKLVNLVGFIIRIYHDERSSECQINLANCNILKKKIDNLRKTQPCSAVAKPLLQWEHKNAFCVLYSATRYYQQYKRLRVAQQ